MMATGINFFAPGTEAGIDYSQIQRQQAMAQALMQRGATPDPGQMMGGRYIAPSALSYVGQLANVLAGNFMQGQADQKESALLKQAQGQRVAEANSFMDAMSGKPAQTVPMAVQNDDEGNPLPQVQTAAVAPDRAKALAIALQSQNPSLQAMGGELMKQQMSDQQLADIMSKYGPGGAGANSAAAPAPGAAPGVPAPTAGGAPAGVNPLAFALTGSGNPTFAKLGGMVQDASKPVNVTEGGTVWNPVTGQPMFTAPKTEAGIGVTNGQAAPIPGFAEAQARREGMITQAKNAADSGATMVTVDTPQGPRMMTRAQAINLSIGGAPSAPPVGPAPQAPASGGVQPRGNFVGTPEQVLGTIDGLNVPAAVKAEMRKAYANQQAGTNPPFNPMGTGALPAPVAAAVPAQSGAPGIALQDDAAKAYDTSRAKDFAAQAASYQTNGQKATGMLRNLAELRSLYSDPNVAQGALAENISGLKNIAASLGVNVQGLPSEQAARAMTNKMALDLRSTGDGGGMPGSLSDSDRRFLVALTPDLTKSPDGRAKIMDAMQKVAQRQIDIARMATMYEQQNGRLDAGFDKVVQDYAAKNQLFTQPAPGGKVNVDDLLKKYQ